MKTKVIIVSEDNNVIELLKLYTNEYEKFEFLNSTSDFLKAYSLVSENSDSILIVDITNYQEQALNSVAKIKSDFPNCKILTLSDTIDIDLVIRSMRVGVSDFITQPIIKNNLYKTFNKLYNSIKCITQKNTKCKIISIYSNKGGVGKTSIATNLAVELSKITKESVALVDLNFQSGDIAAFLDLRPSFNISYFIKNLKNTNKDFLLSTLDKYKDNSLYILADPPFFKQAENISISEITELFNILRDTFSYVIVDTSSKLDKKIINILDKSDLIFFPTIVNLPALRNCQRCLEAFDKSGFEKEKIQIIINRYMENDEITAEDVEEVLNKNIYWKIPNNYFTMMSAINKGMPVSEISPDSNVALSYKNLALIISDSIFNKRKNNDAE